MDSEEGRVKRRNRRTALQILFASKPQDQVDGRLRSREDMDVQYDTNIQSINSNSVPEWVHMPVQPSRNRTRGRIKQRKTQYPQKHQKTTKPSHTIQNEKNNTSTTSISRKAVRKIISSTQVNHNSIPPIFTISDVQQESPIDNTISKISLQTAYQTQLSQLRTQETKRREEEQKNKQTTTNHISLDQIQHIMEEIQILLNKNIIKSVEPTSTITLSPFKIASVTLPRKILDLSLDNCIKLIEIIHNIMHERAIKWYKDTCVTNIDIPWDIVADIYNKDSKDNTITSIKCHKIWRVQMYVIYPSQQQNRIAFPLDITEDLYNSIPNVYDTNHPIIWNNINDINDPNNCCEPKQMPISILPYDDIDSDIDDTGIYSTINTIPSHMLLFDQPIAYQYFTNDNIINSELCTPTLITRINKFQG